ncbi:MAG: biotin synthase BioB [Desulfovibrionaceae bacterium]
MDRTLRTELAAAARERRGLGGDAALAVLRTGPADLAELLHYASDLARACAGSAVRLCAIVNAKGGACSEDCAFCAQSARGGGGAEVFPFRPAAELHAAHRRAGAHRARYFGVVTSGRALGDADVDRACAAVRGAGPGPSWCASMGILGAEALGRLRAAGFRRFHHNLEASRSFFPSICASHAYDERVATLRRARAAGLELCSGGIFGLGESDAQRVELALALAAEGVDSIPINFLVPIPGTRLEGRTPPEPLEMLRAIAMLRLTNPGAELRIAAGRRRLGRLQALLFLAGCTGMMIGDLLTTPGDDVVRDLEMLAALGLEPEERPAPAAPARAGQEA